uniref:AsIV-cont00109-ORF2 n=1 Tax=Apophua simplicipes ichnovirus TaxID=1329648 RepID=S5DRC1_9VIRU|nr:AsIV-cont00109-ORF2 [Apophua simplicipes ichnovirus]
MDDTHFLDMISWSNTNGENFFHEVCRTGSYELLVRVEPYLDDDSRHLLKVVNHQGQSCMHIAVNHSRSVEIMNILRNMGADINGRTSTGGFTVLHEAVVNKAYDVAEWLCQEPDIQIQAKTSANLTAYQLAFVLNDSKMMAILKKYGADFTLLSFWHPWEQTSMVKSAAMVFPFYTKLSYTKPTMLLNGFASSRVFN